MRSLRRQNRQLYFGFAMLVVMLVAVFAIVAIQSGQYQQARRALRGQLLLSTLMRSLQDAETGQRGYLLTGEEIYLRPYSQAVANLDGIFRNILQNEGEAADFREDFNGLRNLSDQKLTELRTTIQLYRDGKRDQALALVREGTGKAIMDRFRTAMEQIQERQKAQLDETIRRGRYQGYGLQGGAILAVLIAGILTLTVARAQRARIAELLSQEAQLRNLNDELVQQVQAREALSAQLQQSQKMDAIGQLTGGLAHDFNNMLAVIISSINLSKRRLGRGDTNIGQMLDGALDGAERAATLTHRLLAFSRQQPLAPVPIEPNRMVAGMEELLRRSLGGNIRLETVLAGGLWKTHADPSQLENSILNLAVNARDAMQEGGKLTIETSNAHLDEGYASRHIGIPAGQYVLIAVSDTGTGISADLLDKVFDPFFTTKPVGKGTGLGLSQVFGFVRQTNGHIKVYSEVGQGTTVKIYLPRFLGEQEEAWKPAPAVAEMPLGNRSELILVTEDDDRVRALAVEALTELGYSVVEANSAATALRELDANPSIRLLFTDIVMPDVNGRKLADEAQRRRPALKVIFTTGYTKNAVVHNGILDHGVHLIIKPYTLEALAVKMREVLDN